MMSTTSTITRSTKQPSPSVLNWSNLNIRKLATTTMMSSSFSTTSYNYKFNAFKTYNFVFFYQFEWLNIVINEWKMWYIVNRNTFTYNLLHCIFLFLISWYSPKLWKQWYKEYQWVEELLPPTIIRDSPPNMELIFVCEYLNYQICQYTRQSNIDNLGFWNTDFFRWNKIN